MTAEDIRQQLREMEESKTPIERREQIAFLQKEKRELLQDLQHLTFAKVPDGKEIRKKLERLKVLDELHHLEFFLWINQTIRQQNQFLRSLQGEGNVGSSADP